MLNRLLVTGAFGGVATQLRPLLTQVAQSVRLSDLHEITDLAAHEEFMAADLGWQPKDNSEQFADEFADLTPYESAIEQGLLTYQGGVWLKAPLITK